MKLLPLWGTVCIALSHPSPGHPAAVVPLNYQQRCLHLLNRLTFGPGPDDLDRVRKMGPRAFINEQLNPDQIDDAQCEGALEKYGTLKMSSADLFLAYPPPQYALKLPKLNGVDADKIKAINEKQKKLLDELWSAKIIRVTQSRRQLQEVMTDFWFNHFNVSYQKDQVKWMLTSYERDAIRPHALGKFRDLVGAVAHSPAMLEYLDNVNSAVDARYVPEDEMSAYPQMMAVTRQPGLNENYARELMELHTLGVAGGYTQQDVIEVARALTGWSLQGPSFLLNPGPKPIDPSTIFQFQFHPRAHDRGKKLILGREFGPELGNKSAEAEGEQVLDLLCGQPATARFIASKLCRHFVSDNLPRTLVEKVADVYMRSHGDIKAMLMTLFTAQEFYDPRYYKAKVKTPLEFIASAVRAADARVDDPVKLAQAVGNLGEPLYLCEPPTGYPDDAKAWVSSGELLDRMNYGQSFLGNDHSPVTVDLSKVVPVRERNERAVLQDFLDTFLQSQVSTSTRLVLVRRLEDPEIAHAVLDDKRRAIQMVKLGALVLGSPDFQRK